MAEDSPGEVTRFLLAAGPPGAAPDERLLQRIYDELRQMAHRRLAGEPKDLLSHTTSLVHEAWMRLVGNANLGWQSRAHFFGAAAEAMRRIIIDRARSRRALKRGGGRAPVALDPASLAAPSADSVDLLALDEALSRLEQLDPRMAQVVKLRFFAGLSVEDTAEALNISARTVNRDWIAARTWLYHELDGTAGSAI
jgi:RNA polymerase sigma factor (TIGR02999 family)